MARAERTQAIESLAEIATRFDAMVLDQWGVLHDGTAPYPGAIDALRALDVPLAVLSNSGKRAKPNAARIASMGFAEDLFEHVMTSGEALWRDIAAGRVSAQHLYPIERAGGDAADWASGLDVRLVDDLGQADAILLMGLPDNAPPDAFDRDLVRALDRAIPILCTNPDRASPRAGGGIVTSPGALAHAHKDRGGEVRFYGKPHAPVFEALEAALGTSNLLMVGDSLEHDIAGGDAAGWATAFVRGGLHAAAFGDGDPIPALSALARAEDTPMPTYTLHQLG
ncbi:TIGR01459 family HAD-type hydrolase [Hasllibacter sp. MH4015]|uniref:TIGR01459 family HAD-type hydrolase n=1 Tax=Hasllibacter sp. MH4015 TaxID=2854029 RepID=UPI001CD29E9B|nr:TIGR01459 family HAD-type hydrolase [Hasllibacter sp. MH4015]